MKLSLVMVCLLLSSCSSRKMWLVNKKDSGGVIAYKNYHDAPLKKRDKDIASVVQCPDTFMLDELTNFKAAPEEVKQRAYTCDTSEAIARMNFAKECNDKISGSCLSLVGTYMGNPEEKERVDLLMEDICQMKDATPMVLAISCYGSAEHEIVDNHNRNLAIKFFEKGCAQAAEIDFPAETISLSCGFLGAYKRDKKLLLKSVAELDQICKEAPDEHCYSLSTMFAIYGDTKSALKYLKISLDGGYKNWTHLNEDPMLGKVRNSAEFKNLINNYHGTRAPASISND